MDELSQKLLNLAHGLHAPLPFKQDNLDLMRGNFAEVVLSMLSLIAVMENMQRRIEQLEAGIG